MTSGHGGCYSHFPMGLDGHLRLKHRQQTCGRYCPDICIHTMLNIEASEVGARLVEVHDR